MKRLINCFIVTIAVIAICLSSEPGIVCAQTSKTAEGSLVQNPCFSEEDLSVWQAGVGGASISAQVGEEPVFDEVTTFGAITDRTSPYDCIAQDITSWVENDAEYTFSFWAKLSDDYQGAPAEQRVIAFAPYITTNVNGQNRTE